MPTLPVMTPKKPMMTTYWLYSAVPVSDLAQRASAALERRPRPKLRWSRRPSLVATQPRLRCLPIRGIWGITFQEIFHSSIGIFCKYEASRSQTFMQEFWSLNIIVRTVERIQIFVKII